MRRARALLGVDVSYLSLNDEAEGKTYIRVTDGSVSALFQDIVLGMGEGLGGLVAQTARPYATSDYFNDKRFHHTSPIDTGVHDEGLTAILGVPLAIGSKVIGVLFASDRNTREFTPDEVVLLVRGDDPGALARALAAELESTMDCAVTVGAAGPACGPKALAEAHAEAARCSTTTNGVAPT